MVEGVLNGLAHHARETRHAHGIRRDPKAALGRAARELRGVNGEPQREMSEHLFDLAGQPAPVRDERSGVLNRIARALRSPWRARQLEGRSQKAMRGTAAREERAVSTAGEEYGPFSTRSRLQFGAPGVGVRDAGLERRTILR